MPEHHATLQHAHVAIMPQQHEMVGLTWSCLVPLQAGQRPHPTTQAPFQATTTAPKVTVAQQQPQPQPQVSPQRVVRERTGLVQRLADLLSDPGSGAGSPVRPGDRPEFEALGPDTLLFGNPQPAISDPGTGRHGVQNAAQHGVQQGSDAEPAKQFMQPTARSAQKPASKQTEGTHASETPAVQQDVQAADAVAVGDKEEMVPMRDLGALLNLRCAGVSLIPCVTHTSYRARDSLWYIADHRI